MCQVKQQFAREDAFDHRPELWPRGHCEEREPLQKICKSGELNAFRHEGFWQCMDTIRDKQIIEEILKNK